MASPRINYTATTLTSGNLVVSGLVRSLSVFATSDADGTFTLQADDPTLSAETITVRKGTGKDINFFDSVRNLTIAHVGGTLDLLVWFTP